MLPWQPLRIEVVVGYTFNIICLRPFSTCYKHVFGGCHGNIIIMLPWQPYKGNICALIHITIVKKYTIISITWGYYVLP